MLVDEPAGDGFVDHMMTTKRIAVSRMFLIREAELPRVSLTSSARSEASERRTYMKRLNMHYSVRSAIVHGQVVAKVWPSRGDARSLS